MAVVTYHQWQTHLRIYIGTHIDYVTSGHMIRQNWSTRSQLICQYQPLHLPFQCQRNITTYFPPQMTQAKRLKSKRVKAVLNRIRTPCVTSPQRDVTSKTVAMKAKRRRKNGGKVTGGGEATAAAGGFLGDGKPEVTSELVLSETSSGSDSDSGATNRTGRQLNSQAERTSSALLKGRELDTARRQRKT